ncbi:MAG: hypothetical protein JWQ89_41 [Devosia sp.]|uniref:SH3 domain-containing protein n=1 Tax=Devosia sp. TaxID=1871048 RepID=UPI00261E2691|nr:SH3 domain-containing protein [Devosia sp.]MDB5538314.1 hypothetical protein [Devosia sp.]
MSLNRLALGASGALFALALAAPAATAAEAFASAAVNVRAGAGASFAVVDVLGPGQPVAIDYCRGAWCLIRQSGPDGWVNANFLTADSYGGGRDYNDEEDYYPYPDYTDRDYAGGYYGGERFYDDYFFLERPHQRYRNSQFYGSEICIAGVIAQVCARD